MFETVLAKRVFWRTWQKSSNNGIWEHIKRKIAENLKRRQIQETVKLELGKKKFIMIPKN